MPKQTNTHRCSGLFFWHHLLFVCVFLLWAGTWANWDLWMPIFKTRSCQGGFWVWSKNFILYFRNPHYNYTWIDNIEIYSIPKLKKIITWEKALQDINNLRLKNFDIPPMKKGNYALFIWLINFRIVYLPKQWTFGSFFLSLCSSALLSSWGFSQRSQGKTLGFSKKQSH